MDPLIILIMEIFRDYLLETQCGLLILKCFDLMKASNWDLLMLNCLTLYLEIYVESHLGLMLEHSWPL